MEETWKWVAGYEGIYQISNYGRFKSFRANKEGYITSQKNKYGWYFTVNLYKDNSRKTVRIHRLVAEAFIGEIPKGFHVHHKDGNRQNNIVTNLEIVPVEIHVGLTLKENENIVNKMTHYNKYERPRHIEQYDLEGNWVASYCNASFASEFSGVCARNILQVASKTPYGNKGKIRKQAGGFIWKFTDK